MDEKHTYDPKASAQALGLLLAVSLMTGGFALYGAYTFGRLVAAWCLL